jgi:ribose transport system substrate-binding protein
MALVWPEGPASDIRTKCELSLDRAAEAGSSGLLGSGWRMVMMTRGLVLGLLASAALSLGACGQGDSAKAPAASGPAEQAGLARAQAVIDQYKAAPAFVAPGEPFDARACAKGKTMVSIPNNSGNPFLKGIIDRMKIAGQSVGLNVVEWQNQGQPSQWVQGVDSAIRTKAAAVNLISGIDPATIEPQIKAAQAAGVKVMTSHFYDPTQVQNPNLSSNLTVSFATAGKILADWAAVRTGGKANILLIKSDEVPPTAPLVKGFKDELAANCPQCRIVQEVNVGVTEWATKIQPSVQTALLANGDINIIIPIYDSMTQFVLPAVQLTGKKAQVKIATFNGTPFVLDEVRRGNVDMDIGESVDWIAYATIDGHLRDICGLPSPSALNVPFYIFDQSNVGQAGEPADYAKGYGDTYVAGFRRLWGLP